MSKIGSPIRGVSGVCLLLTVLLLAGCRATAVPMQVEGTYQAIPASGIDFGSYDRPPKSRLGALPYPGLLSLFAVADPADLGRHAYDDSGAERSRGILYSCRGGFIDVAHLRECIDLCKYAAVRVEFALLNDWSVFQIKGEEPSIYLVHLQYPPFWTSLAPAERKHLAHELSIRIGQRIARLVMTWHELLTWFGYETVPPISEWRSAFTWDDADSHFLGVLVGGRALHDDDLPWDDAVTLELNRALRELGAVTPKQTMEAVDRVHGLWWSGIDPLKRDFDLGLDGQPVEPWLVRNLPFCRDAVPYRYELPRLDAVYGYDFRGLVRIEIDPKVGQTGKIRDVLPGHPQLIDVNRDLPILLNHMKQWHIQHDGPQSVRPY